MPAMAYARNMARGDTVDSRFRGTLAAKSALSNPRTANRHLHSNWLAGVLRGAGGGQLVDPQDPAHGPSHRSPRNDVGYCAHAASDLARRDVVPPPQGC